MVAAFFFGAEWKDRAWAETVALSELALKKAEVALFESVRREEHAKAQQQYLLMESVNDILEQEDTKTEVVYREIIKYQDNPNAGTCVFPVDGLQIINRAAGMPTDSAATATADNAAP